MAFFIGRLIGYKGLDILLRALELVPGAHAAIAGDGLLRDELERQASALGVADRAHFLGPISEQDKLGWLHASDLFVLPSVTNAEAFGIVQVEAQMCGLPVVASNLPTGVSDVTVDGETGFLVEPGDARALAGAMAAIFADKARARAMGEAGRRRAHEKYSREAFQRANREVFRAVAEEP